MPNSSIQALWYAGFQSENPEKFNKDFIYKRNEEEDTKSILESIAVALEVIPNIKFTGCTLETDESRFQDIHKIEESRLILAVLSFHLTCEDAGTGEILQEDVSVRLFLPKIVDNFYFQLNGNRYYAIYQMIDRGTYNVNGSIGLKTMLMPFLVSKEDFDIVDTLDNVYHGRSMKLDVFKRAVNILLYFISESGLEETLVFFGVRQFYEFTATTEVLADEADKYIFFSVSKTLFLRVNKEFFEQDKWFTFTLINLLSKTKLGSFEEAQDPEFWNFQLGKIYTTNKDQAKKKAFKIHSSIRRILDRCTIENMVHVDAKDKKSIYHIFRWILTFFEELSHEDNMDLKNKRMRLNEYILYPFIRKLSTETYRCLNTKKMTMKTLTSVFSNIKPNLCIKQLVTNELLRYVNCVNCIDIFSSALKITQAGPQGVAGSDNMLIRYRGHHPSYLGKIGLNAASAGDPGVTATMTPFIKTEGLFFDKTVEHKTPNEFPDVLHLVEAEI